MSVATIRTQLTASLNAMQSIKQVFNYEANELTQYPAATLTLREGQGEFASQAHNRRTRGFRVRVYVERTQGFSSQNAERIAVSVIDELETHFDNNTTLSGICKFVQPVDWNASYVDRELNTRVLEINIEAVELTTSQ